MDVIAYLQTFEPTPTNTAPQAIDDSYGVSSRNTLTISATAGVLSNDLDADGDSLTAVLVSTSTGALALSGDGSFQYTPGADFVVSDSFRYRANDGTSDGNVATVTLAATDSDGDGLADFIEDEIGSSSNSSDTDGDGASDLEEYLAGSDPTRDESNTPPDTVSDGYVVSSRKTLSVNVGAGFLSNDIDADGDTLTAKLVSSPAGTLTLFADGSFQFTPAPDFVLTDSFQYKSNDGQSDGDVATVTLAAADSDGDGLADFIEDEIGSSNNSSDTDGDGVSDLAEYLSGRDPTINEGAIIIIILQSVLK